MKIKNAITSTLSLLLFVGFLNVLGVFRSYYFLGFNSKTFLETNLDFSFFFIFQGLLICFVFFVVSALIIIVCSKVKNNKNV